jgi:hypothetical protein
MKHTARLVVTSVILCVSIGLSSQAPAADDPGGDIAGYIDQIRGEVYFKKTRLDETVKLTRINVRQALHPGERVRCGQGGYLKICVYKQCKEIKGPSEWYPIPHIPLSESDARRIALQRFWGGGRPRGGGTVIFSPADDSVVVPDRLTIQWATSDEDKSVTLTILSDANHVIWQEENADGATGLLVSESARKALLKYRNDRGKGLLKLVLVRPNEQSEQARFSILSLENEQSLQQELMKWDKEEASLLRHAYRAYAFSSRGMLTEWVEEYEAALAETPESHDLLVATINANRGIGNARRVSDLMKRLSPGTKMP